jgi:hypothetical protein
MSACLKGAVRGAVARGVVGLFGPFLLWKLLHSSWVDPDSTYGWFREIGFRTGPEPPVMSILLGLTGLAAGTVLGGLLAFIDTMRDPSTTAAFLDASSDGSPPAPL